MTLAEPAAASLARWHEMVATKDMSGLREIVHPDAVFRSPVAHTPYPGADAVVLVLSTVLTVFEDFTYRRTFTDDGDGVVLEFGARVGDRTLRGVDVITFDDDGLITEFEVLIRPLSALQALGGAMAAKLEGQQLTGQASARST